MDGKDAACVLSSAVGSFLQDRLLDRGRRVQHKEQCAERLAADSHNATTPTDANYADQAVLANLDWGIDALEDAVATSNPEAKLARLDHAERMLRVCAMLDPNQFTAGVPNSYLSAWAHLNLAYLYKLKDNAGRDAVLNILNMFDIDPFFSRIDFAPELWEAFFLPHMSSIVGWYSETRHRIVMDTIPDSSDLSLTVDFDDHFFNESLILSVRPDQAEKLRKLEREYVKALDHNTRMYARYFKEVVAGSDSAAGRKGMVALPPIAEPPATPVHEVSSKIPDFVKFGPILPKSAGFAPLVRDNDADVAGACSPNSGR